ncbi:MAG: response regulator [Clostridiales bacterium]|nr:response regulator [Clostridiales bacterium]
MYKVVLVDDESIIVQGLKKVVDWAKYECEVVATANDAKSGAAAIREHKPDILFTDIRMPDLDGLTMIAGLKSEFPRLQLTVLTGYREFDYAKRAISLGATRFLLKPSKMAEIEEALEAMTEKLRRERKIAETEVPEEEEKTESNSFIVNAALKYIDSHFAEKLSLSELADKIYVSQWYLSKLLNKYTDKTFYDLVNQARIKKAKALLRDPALKIGDISEMVGFMDVSHFSRTFKKTENISPKDYRNSLTI